MLKDFILVGIGSFLGGGMRFLVSHTMQTLTSQGFPWGTFAVNILGCLIFGFVCGLDLYGNIISPRTKLLLTTGLCGGFTTFSTFMSENASLLSSGHFLEPFVYIGSSLALGLIGVFAGLWIAKAL